jgi:hypothetical protein
LTSEYDLRGSVALLIPAQHSVVDGHVAGEFVAHDRGGMNERDFLRYHADMDGIAPEILVGINAEAVAAASEQCDVALEAGIRKLTTES